MEAIKELIKEAKNKGFTVYAPEALSSYFYFTTGEKVGYCQFDNMRGVRFCTVHKPSQENGTGFAVDSFESALGVSPFWASNKGGIVKFSSWDEFSRKHWQKLTQY